MWWSAVHRHISDDPTHTDEQPVYLCHLAIDGKLRDRRRFAGGERDGRAVRMRAVGMVGLDPERGAVGGPDIGIREGNRDSDRIAEHDDGSADLDGNHRGRHVHGISRGCGLHLHVQC